MAEATQSEVAILIEQFREQAKQLTASQQKTAELEATIRQLQQSDEKKQVNFMIRQKALDRVKREANRNGITQNQQFAIIVETWAANNPDEASSN